MLAFDEAVEIVTAHCAWWGTETIGLEEAMGRALAEVVTADRDYPPFNRATMDGFAVCSDDVLEHHLTQFRVIGELFAGSGAHYIVKSGEAVKIMTGAPLPDTTDSVIKKEDAVERDGVVTFHLDNFKPGQSVAHQGEDLRAGSVVMANSVEITPARSALLASLGKREVCVAKRPRVALISTGDEIRHVGDTVASFQIRDANRYSIAGFLHRYGIHPSSAAIVPDRLDALKEAFRAALDQDVIIISGGVSAGDADLVPQALESCNVREIFHKVKLRPGKPLWFGRHEGGARVFALPGNPFSVQAACRLFIEPFLRASFHLDPLEPITLPISGGRAKRVSFDEFFPAKIVQTNGAHIEPISHHSSGDITAALEADGLAHHPASASDLEEGAPVDLYLWQPLR